MNCLCYCDFSTSIFFIEKERICFVRKKMISLFCGKDEKRMKIGEAEVEAMIPGIGFLAIEVVGVVQFWRFHGLAWGVGSLSIFLLVDFLIVYFLFLAGRKFKREEEQRNQIYKEKPASKGNVIIRKLIIIRKGK